MKSIEKLHGDTVKEVGKRILAKPGKKIRLADFDPGYTGGIKDKKKEVDLLREGVKELAAEQDKLYAQNTYGVLVLFQAMDAGHGTTVAWAGSSFAAGVEGALETGFASATLGLVLGGVVAGPVAVWLLTRRTVGALHETTFAAGVEPPASAEPPFSSDRWLRGIFWLAVALGVGPLLRDAADGQGWNLPGFLTAMAVAIMLTNAADALRRPVDTEVTDLIGTVALRVFLAITLLSLDWMSLADRLPAVLTGAMAQVSTR